MQVPRFKFSWFDQLLPMIIALEQALWFSLPLGSGSNRALVQVFAQHPGTFHSRSTLFRPWACQPLILLGTSLGQANTSLLDIRRRDGLTASAAARAVHVHWNEARV